MLKEQRDLYLNLADALLSGLNVDEVKKTLQRGKTYYSNEYTVGNTGYFLALTFQRLWSAGEGSLSMCGYITATQNDKIIKTHELRIIRVLRSVNSNFLHTDKETIKKTLTWMVEEFKTQVLNEDCEVRYNTSKQMIT